MSDCCYKCPNCGHVTFGVKAARNAAPIICPKCQKEGVTVVMTESPSGTPSYMGDGLFKKTTELNESRQLLNE